MPPLPTNCLAVTGGGSRTGLVAWLRCCGVGSLIELPSVSEQTPKLLGYLARPNGDGNRCLVEALPRRSPAACGCRGLRGPLRPSEALAAHATSARPIDEQFRSRDVAAVVGSEKNHRFAISSGVPNLPSGTAAAIVLRRCSPSPEASSRPPNPGVSV